VNATGPTLTSPLHGQFSSKTIPTTGTTPPGLSQDLIYRVMLPIKFYGNLIADKKGSLLPLDLP
jgi:hypothetical protein